MCFNDDFDGYDGMDDPDDDFSEDLFEEEFEPELDELELGAETDEPIDFEPEDLESAFDLQDVFIIGGMIVGQAYEDALDDSEAKKSKQKKENGDD